MVLGIRSALVGEPLGENAEASLISNKIRAAVLTRCRASRSRPGKRVRIAYLLDLLGAGLALLENSFQAVGQPGQHGVGLFVQRGPVRGGCR
jgi:hypothetical protein